ncbi:MAG: serine hydrolase [Gemmatimonadota bacterium]|uniref:serine hydrolase domain-containing protein n=1 Tax=Candidatus Palauibacter scopulicola TaxID=3056741 RepID=UPI002391A6EC|nr:serine hydrolase domain-containing protein [Candidatus Palauibacter scopulicola]MDE2661934.1 serine hydrolase [Candidatus Palauibacter scopulicola]
MPVHRRPSRARAASRPYPPTIFFLLVFFFLPFAATGQDANVIDAFSRQIAADVEADGIGGITAAVFKGDQVLWAQGFGWADPANRVPAGVRTIYRTGSISKSVTAILMADLVEEGTVALDDAVVDHLPEAAGFGDPPAGMEPITLRQLASHTAGLIREPELEGAAAGPIEDWGYKILASIPHTRFYTMPGTQYQYSNIGYGVLGYALQRAAGTSFMDLVEDRLFEPLGMRSSTFIVGPDLWRRVAVGFANGADGEVNADFPALEHEGRGYKVPNGGVYATVGDLATFGAAVMGMTEYELLEPATRRDVMTVQTPEDPDSGYGLGFSIRPVALEGGGEVRFVGHGGSVAGYNMYLVFEPESGYGVALGRNYNRGATSLGEAGNGLLQALLEADS